MNMITPLFYAIVVITVVLVGSQMVLSVQHSRDGEQLEAIDHRIERLNEEVIVASENIAIFRSAGYIRYVASNRYGLQSAQTNDTVYLRLRLPQDVKLSQVGND